MLLELAPYAGCFLGGAVVGTAGLKNWIARGKTQLAKLPATVAELKATNPGIVAGIEKLGTDIKADVAKL